MSDMKKNGFASIDIGSLDCFNADRSRKTRQTDPEDDQFKPLCDPSEFGPGELDTFEPIYSGENEKKADSFTPLFGEKQKPGTAKKPKNSREDKKPDDSLPHDLKDTPEISLEDQAVEQGFAKGYEDGCQKGHSEGYEKGFEKGREEGFAQGQTQGFAKGESEGFAKGEADGVKKGEKASRAESSHILDSLQKSLSAVDTVLNDVVDVHEQELVELVFKIAEKAVHASLDTTDDIVRKTIVDALKTLAQPRDIELSVSPEDYEYIEMVKDSFFEAVTSLQHVAVKSDPMVHRGGCRIETDTASVSTDPEAKLAAVYEAVKAAARQ